MDNGFNPIWNEDFTFNINCPELAFIKFKVMDKDTGSKDDLIGYYAIRFENIRPGIYMKHENCLRAILNINLPAGNMKLLYFAKILLNINTFFLTSKVIAT